MRFQTAVAAALLLAAPPILHADGPNIQPGEWEYENVTTFEGDMDIPEQSHTTRECVTQDDIDEGLVTPDEADMGDCEITDRQVSSSSMSYQMHCVDDQGSEMSMSAQMQFMGDRASGTIDGEMDSAMGRMEVRTTMEGRRIGDC